MLKNMMKVHGDFMNPTTINLVNSEVKIIYNQQGDPRDVDYFTFNVPAGSELTEIFIDSFNTTDLNNNGFIGVQSGTSFSTDENSTTAADLLGRKVFGAQDEDFNILASMGLLNGSTRYVGALPTGDYII